MKRPGPFRGACLGVLALALCAGAGARAAEPAAKLVVEPASFDFGQVRQEQTLVKEFRLRNDGDAELRIESVQPDCGCTVVGDYQADLAPGAETTLRVTVQTRSYRGHVRKQVAIKSNDPALRPFRIRLEATVVADER